MNKKQFLLLLILVVIWRTVDFLIIYLAPRFISYLGSFSYSYYLNSFHLPHWVKSLANFDGIFYLRIAKSGYSQYEQAFFPLYPLLIKTLTPVFNGNPIVAGLVISNVCFFAGLVILLKTIDLKKGGNYLSLLILILAFPTSFFFGAVYTEALFFLLVVTFFYFLKKKQLFLASIFAILSPLTRLIGVFLVIPTVFDVFRDSKHAFKNIFYILFPIIGLSFYCLYLLKSTGDPFYFFSSQPMFGAGRSTHFIILPQVYWRYLKIFFTAAHDFKFFVSVIEFLFFNFVFIILIIDLLNNVKIIKDFKFRIKSFYRLNLSVFSLINILIPTLTGTLLSIPRFSLMSISFFIFLSEIDNKWTKIALTIMFIVLHIILLGLFSQGYFIA